MKNKMKWGVVVGTALALLSFTLYYSRAQQADENLIYWHGMQANLIAQEQILALGRQVETPDTVITNVNVVQLPEGTVLENAAVLIEDGEILWVGPQGEVGPVFDVHKIDGIGGWLAPTAVDMTR